MDDNNELSLDAIEGIDDLDDFDAAEHLGTPVAIAAFLSSALASGDMEHIKQAIKTAARAQSMAKLAQGAGVTREGAYKALKPGTKPQMGTILGLLDALGMAIIIVPKASDDDGYALAA
jgi:probable addiction module antidote protein